MEKHLIVRKLFQVVVCFSVIFGMSILIPQSNIPANAVVYPCCEHTGIYAQCGWESAQVECCPDIYQNGLCDVRIRVWIANHICDIENHTQDWCDELFFSDCTYPCPYPTSQKVRIQIPKCQDINKIHGAFNEYVVDPNGECDSPCFTSGCSSWYEPLTTAVCND
jgi:hypothetical protein